MKTTCLTFVLLTMLSINAADAQFTTDSLTLQWENSSQYGSRGQRAVVINDTIYHVGGRFEYGVPYGMPRWSHSYIEFKAPSSDTWKVGKFQTIGRYYINAESYGGRIYIFGGHNVNGVHQSEVEICDPRTETISYGTPMPNSHSNAGSVEHNGKVYIIGGFNGTAQVANVDIYDVPSDSWTSGAPLPIAMNTEAVYYDGKIYTIGGYDGMATDEIFAYDIAADSWQLVGTSPYPVSAHRLAIYQDYIYVVGDYTELESIMRYRISDESWTVYESNYFGRSFASTAIVGDKLYAIGGYSRRSGLRQEFSIVQSIDLSTVTAVSGIGEVPREFEVSQNFPNPFNPGTAIRFNLAEGGRVSLVIYDVLGTKIKEIVNDYAAPGEYAVQWEGKNDQGNAVASGQYFYTINVGDGQVTKRMLLVK